MQFLDYHVKSALPMQHKTHLTDKNRISNICALQLTAYDGSANITIKMRCPLLAMIQVYAQMQWHNYNSISK